MTDFIDANPADLSATMRDYLVQVYRISDRGAEPGGYVSTSAVAESVAVSAPAVNRMIGRLRAQGLVDHEPYRGIRLTADGAREALKQLRRQRIIEVFLLKVMALPWHHVGHEADRLVAATSDTLVERMFRLAGQPTTCPHGEPIPTPDGGLDPIDDTILTAAPHHINLVVTRLRTREPDRLEYLGALELMPGAQLQVHHAAPFNGPLQLKLEGQREAYRIIGHNLAEMLRVRQADG